jgi:prophage regulatory protein
MEPKISASRSPTAGARPTLLRLPQIIGPDGVLPVGKSTWWAGVASGRYPKPVKLGPRITAWREEDIRALVTEGVPNG